MRSAALLRLAITIVPLTLTVGCEDGSTTHAYFLSAGNDETCILYPADLDDVPLDAGSDGGIDAGFDSSPVDAGSDSSPSDAAPTDGGPSDGGPSDGGPSDGGPADAGVPVDAGGDPLPDAGPRFPGPASGGRLQCWGAQDDPRPRLRLEPLIPLVSVTWGPTRCVRTIDSQVLCWGENDRGQLTMGTTSTDRPIPLLGIANPEIAIARFGGGTVCGIEGGRLRCWGAGTENQLGDGSSADRARAERVIFPTEVVTYQVALGPEHVCAATDAGAFCWGTNVDGRVGDGSRNQALFPRLVVRVEGMGTIVKFALGRAHTCALDDAGAVWCWGDDEFGQTGQMTVGIDIAFPQRVDRVGPAVDLQSGEDHICAVEVEGDVRCWGRNDLFQTTHTVARSVGFIATVPGIASPRQLVLGANHACVLLSGEVRCWGASARGQLGRSLDQPQRLPLPVLGLR